MKRSTTTVLLLSVLALTMFSCSKKEISETTAATPQLPATPYVYSTGTLAKVVSLTWNEGHMVLKSAAANPVTNDGAKLGRVLFHDYTISGTSCKSCHNGNTSASVARDLFLQKDFINSSGTDIHPAIGIEDAGTLTAKIASKPYYLQLFQEAYGTPQITTERLSDALVQYMTAMSGASATDPRFADPFK